MLYLCYLCRFKPLRDHLRGFLIAAWAGDKIAEFSFPEISFHFPLRPWFFCKPRVCGEKRLCAPPIASAVGSPPRMRGKVVAHCVRQNAVRITPAYAGKRPGNVSGAHNVWDHPRVCGEKQVNTVDTYPPAGSPPRMRGKVREMKTGKTRRGITPAYAGKRK